MIVEVDSSRYATIRDTMDNHVHPVMPTYHRNSYSETTTRLNESMEEVETSDSIHSMPVPSHRGRVFRDFVGIRRGSFPRLKKTSETEPKHLEPVRMVSITLATTVAEINRTSCP